MELVETADIKLLAKLASKIWHEYWPCLLSEDQINYMVKNFQSEEAISEQIKMNAINTIFLYKTKKLSVIPEYQIKKIIYFYLNYTY